MISTKRTFIHTFKNGNRCELTIDFDDTPKVDAKWARKVTREWPEIEPEYLKWRTEAFEQYMSELTPAQQWLVVGKLN
jgi:hypothetical protein